MHVRDYVDSMSDWLEVDRLPFGNLPAPPAALALLRNTICRRVISTTCENPPKWPSPVWHSLGKSCSLPVDPAQAGVPLLRNTRKTGRGTAPYVLWKKLHLGVSRQLAEANVKSFRPTVRAIHLPLGR
jgi:hypothetical protein